MNENRDTRTLQSNARGRGRESRTLKVGKGKIIAAVPLKDWDLKTPFGRVTGGDGA